MRVKAYITPDGAFVPGYLTCDEFSMLNYIFFLLDTGSAISALSITDLGENIDYSTYEKKSEAAIGIGGSLECYLIHNVKLYLYPLKQKRIEAKTFKSLCILPPSFDQIADKKIIYPSIIGRDILGKEFDLIYGKESVYLEK